MSAEADSFASPHLVTIDLLLRSTEFFLWSLQFSDMSLYSILKQSFQNTRGEDFNWSVFFIFLVPVFLLHFSVSYSQQDPNDTLDVWAKKKPFYLIFHFFLRNVLEAVTSCCLFGIHFTLFSFLSILLTFSLFPLCTWIYSDSEGSAVWLGFLRSGNFSGREEI